MEPEDTYLSKWQSYHYVVHTYIHQNMRVMDILSQIDLFVFDDHFDRDASFFIHFPLIKKISSLHAPPHTSQSQG